MIVSQNVWLRRQQRSDLVAKATILLKTTFLFHWCPYFQCKNVFCRCDSKRLELLNYKLFNLWISSWYILDQKVKLFICLLVFVWIPYRLYFCFCFYFCSYICWRWNLRQWKRCLSVEPAWKRLIYVYL